MQFDSKVFSMIEADSNSNSKTKYDSPFMQGGGSGHRKGHSITAMSNYNHDKTPGRSLITSLNGPLNRGNQ